MIQKRTLFAAALCLHAPKSQAYSCPPPAIPNASASKENIQEAKVRDVTNLLSPRTSNEYLAFGVFTPKSNKPFAHTREIEERNAHHQANPNAETTGLIEYTYLRAIEFHG